MTARPCRTLCLALALVTTAAVSGRQAERAPYEFRYHQYEDSTALLKGLAGRYPDLAKMYSIGKTATGLREIWCIEIGNQKTGPAEEKPATYFDGSQHATEVVGGETTLYLAYYLLTNYGRDTDVTRLLDTRVTYIVQRADPDGAEAWMTGKVDWPPAITPTARDIDGDGTIAEDAPEDIDGDGDILKMRIVDPNGPWKLYEPEPRLLVHRRPEDREGPFYRVMDEGIDNDGDGQINEDPPFDYNHTFISNRNYPVTGLGLPGKYDYPLKEHNARMLIEFIVGRPNISQVQSFHTTGGLYLGATVRPMPAQDLHDLTTLLRKMSEITGYPVAPMGSGFTQNPAPATTVEQPGIRRTGTFTAWAYGIHGMFAMTTELLQLEQFLNEVGWGTIARDRLLWSIPALPEGVTPWTAMGNGSSMDRPDVQARLLMWLDAHKGSKDLAGHGFTEWRPFNHPTLGPVEIGGFTRYFLRNPPPGRYFEQTVTPHARAAVVQALTTPLVKIRKVDVVRSGNAWQITARVLNEGFFDTSTEQARLIAGWGGYRLARPVEVQLQLPPGAKTADPRRVMFPLLRGMRGATFETPYDVSWRVEAPVGASITIVLRSQRAGTDRRTVTLAATADGPAEDRQWAATARGFN